MAQTTPNTPLARVKTGAGSKKDLIEQLKGLATPELWVDRLNKDQSWSGISNAKLLRLQRVLTEVKNRFGSRDGLINAVIAAEGKTKDTDYRKKFASWPLPRLLDALQSAERRSKQASKAASKPKA